MVKQQIPKNNLKFVWIFNFYVLIENDNLGDSGMFQVFTIYIFRITDIINNYNFRSVPILDYARLDVYWFCIL